ncbi:orexin/Hypocretin receptor type 1-like [Saccostrea cucullata]|uniref:orexin/Hypocretin receptor type 1-like n=1 Tax=Saccostrea cuccullata TaxID=36930 RepID=UPI002ED010B5
MNSSTVQQLADNFTRYKSNKQESLSYDEFLELDHNMALTLLPVAVIMSVLMILGIMGNLAVCYIYLFRWKKKTVKYFVGFLAAYDLLTSVICMPIEIAMLQHPITLDDPHLCRFQRFTRSVTSLGAGLMLVVIAVDRYMKICRLARSQIQIPLAKKLCSSTAVVALLFSWPCLIIFGQSNKMKSPIAETSCPLNREYSDTPYPALYYGMVAVLFLIISLCLLIFYSLVLNKLCRYSATGIGNKTNNQITERYKTNTTSSSPESLPDDSTNLNTNVQNWSQHKSSPVQPKPVNSMSNTKKIEVTPHTRTSSQNRMRRTTIMLLLITFIQWTSYFPYFGLLFARRLNADFILDMSVDSQIFYNIGVRSHFLSCGINPFMYGFLSRDFREEFHKSFLSIKNTIF